MSCQGNVADVCGAVGHGRSSRVQEGPDRPSRDAGRRRRPAIRRVIVAAAPALSANRREVRGTACPAGSGGATCAAGSRPVIGAASRAVRDTAARTAG
ncbi:Hypothetical protein I596_2733 [Dokdonella koreensis DS-123]|uniref:Uncharacterized protein n=1 Tax=Dokdonella koreensis DS-123 TaxID=1300342 RepID=A0A160DVX5_9GAMM|nr:Hypothetical protein I596_2733 [Dokdonella koreensis DS-123]